MAATLLLVLLILAGSASGQILVPQGSVWRYLDGGVEPAADWREQGFDDGSWASGPAELGYGDGGEATVVDGGPAGQRFIATYYRHSFVYDGSAPAVALVIRLLRDDGAIVHLNGSELLRSNMPEGPVDHTTRALVAASGGGEVTFYEWTVPSDALAVGDNALAVEIHQSSPRSSDTSFDMELALRLPGPPRLVRGPYLQLGTSHSMRVRWRTDIPTQSRLAYGPGPSELDEAVVELALVTEHEVEVAGLEPGTTTFYAIGSPAEPLAGADAEHFFRTAPLPGTRAPVRIWVIGDSGECADSLNGCVEAEAVRDAYLQAVGDQPADVWIALGDNAYNTGSDQEYTIGHFEIFATLLRNTVLWPVPGNHEFPLADSAAQSGPYYDAFTLPTLAEAGGVPSGTEAYYSFDFGSVHFVALDSHDTDRSEGGLMWSWLEADLMASDAEFTIAYWHHPPYTKGSHDSDCGGASLGRPASASCTDPGDDDSSGRMIEMRENFLPLLESHGVDLQLTGHSHSYERSLLLDGHYGYSDSFDPALHAVDAGDGSPSGDGAYAKPMLARVPHAGTVYSVVGSSSKNSGGLGSHPVMTAGINFEGSLLIDIENGRLDARFIDRDGIVGDRFSIEKVPEPTSGASAAAALLGIALASSLASHQSVPFRREPRRAARPGARRSCRAWPATGDPRSR